MTTLFKAALAPPHPQGGALGTLDPRARLLGLLTVVACVVSHGKYELLALIPYTAFPALMIIAGTFPLRPLLARLLLIMPFAVLVGIANPFLDTTLRTLPGGVQVAGGWISFTGIVFRVCICASSALVIVATTPFARLCSGARQLGLPGALTTVILFLGRYIHLLLAEGIRVTRAREARAAGRLSWRSGAGVVGNLFLRTLDRAGRIQNAMLARGFTGQIPRLHRDKWQEIDWAFTILVVAGSLGWRLLALNLEGLQ